jgi:hypothetical protein
MNYATEMGSGAVTFIPSFMTIRSGIQNLLEGREEYNDAHVGWR